MELSKELKETLDSKIKSQLQESYELVQADYRCGFEGLDNEINNCIQNESDESLIEVVYEWYNDSMYESAMEEVKCINKTILKEYEDCVLAGEIADYLEEVSDDTRLMIEERDNSDYISKCLGYTDSYARIIMCTNYESLTPPYENQPYSYEMDEYFKAIVDLFNLNPKLVREFMEKEGMKCDNDFPDIKEREGNEYVRYHQFASEINNQMYHCNLVLLAQLPIQEMYQNNFKSPDYVIIPKCNICGLHNQSNGSGSILEIELIRDLQIPIKKPYGKTEYDYFKIVIDSPQVEGGYSVKSVYGVSNEVYGNKVKLVYEKEVEPINIFKDEKSKEVLLNSIAEIIEKDVVQHKNDWYDVDKKILEEQTEDVSLLGIATRKTGSEMIVIGNNPDITKISMAINRIFGCLGNTDFYSDVFDSKSGGFVMRKVTSSSLMWHILNKLPGYAIVPDDNNSLSWKLVKIK